MKGKDFLGGILLGAIVGAAMGLLLAPQSGEETREQLGDTARDLGDKVKDSSRQWAEKGSELIETGKSQVLNAVRRNHNGDAVKTDEA